MLPILGLTLGVDALGRAGAAPTSPSFAHWLIPRISAELYDVPGTLGSTVHSSPHIIDPHSLIREITSLTPFYR